MSSYISPAPQGDDKATGAFAVAIAATPGGTNNDGHATDSAGNVAVDFAWGNFPLQPNDVRRAAVSNFGGVRGSDVVTVITDGPMRDIPGEGADYGWSTTTMVSSDNLAYGNISKALNNGLTFAVRPDSHEIAEAAYAAFPSFVKGSAVYIVTQASGDGVVQTYTAPNNFLSEGDVVNITGTGLDGDSLTVASANRYTFTVSGSATGTFINISGKVRYANELTATDGAYIAGVAFVAVPDVRRQTVSSATDALTDASLVVTAASAATVQISKSYRAGGGGLTKITTSEAHGFLAGDVVVVAGTNGNPDLEGTWTIIDVPTATTFRYQTVTSGTITEADDTGTCKVAALAGKVWKQSIAAGASSIAAGAAVTITPYAA